MDAATAVLTIAALVIGLIAGWWFARSRAATEVARAQTEAAALRDDRDRQYDLYRDAVEHARAEQRATAERAARENSVLTALAPVKDTLERMQRAVSGIEQERQAQYGALSEQLRRAHESDEALRATTESLAGALRSSATRGVWGETQLRRVVEAAGLTRHVNFDLQATISSDRGQGRPDMVIRLAGGASIAVDAKVPLDAYLEASALTGDDDRRAVLMQKHVKAVRTHVDALAKKTYWSGLDASPEFVICFLPTESLLAAAVDADPTLLDYAFGRRVALASPVNLWWCSRRSPTPGRNTRCHRKHEIYLTSAPSCTTVSVCSPVTRTTCGGPLSVPSTATTVSPGPSRAGCLSPRADSPVSMPPHSRQRLP